MRKVLSALLLGVAGSFVCGITAGIATIFVYGLGLYLGIPMGLVTGASLGWRTPLRDSVIMFVCYFALFVVACWHCGTPSGDPSADFGRTLLWAVVLGPGGFLLPRLPVLWLSFAHRHVLAMVLAVTWGVGCAVWVYWRLWVWQP